MEDDTTFNQFYRRLQRAQRANGFKSRNRNSGNVKKGRGSTGLPEPFEPSEATLRYPLSPFPPVRLPEWIGFRTFDPFTGGRRERGGEQSRSGAKVESRNPEEIVETR